MNDAEIEQLLQASAAQHRAGLTREAETGYRKILQFRPDHPGALNLLGTLAGQAGHTKDAINLIGRAVSLRSNDASILNNYATALRQGGRVDDAIRMYVRSISLREDPESIINLGQVYRDTGKMQDALGCFHRATELSPHMAVAWRSLGSLLLQLNAIDDAIPALQRAVELSPNMSLPLRELSIALHQVSRFSESADTARRALAINPNDAFALGHLALSLKRMGNPQEAQAYFEQIMTIPANTIDELFNRAVAMEQLGRLEEAAVSYRQALESQPGSVPVLLNLGSIAQQLGDSEEAMKLYEQAIAVAPEKSLPRLNRGVILLLKGRFSEGWKEYDFRWRCPERHPPMPSFRQPLWRTQDVAGKTVLLHSEQGFGDAIQFIRYAPLVSAKGARVIAAVHPELLTLFRSVKGIDQVVSRMEPAPDFDLHAPLMDLPMIMGTVLANVPADVPYIHPDAEKAARWASRLAADEPNGRPILRVGLIWAGRATHPYDKMRSIALEKLAPLANLNEHIEFVSLQKGEPTGQLNDLPAGFKVRPYGDELADFSDAAALLANVDLLLTVDTAIAHLGGSLGIPLWILLPVAPDWRWLEHRETSPWYPTARLFRQKERGDWSPVIERLAKDLRGMVKSKKKG